MNIFIVNSPFQYICALEAKNNYKTRNNILVLLKREHKLQQAQLQKIIDNSNWDKILEVEEKNRTIVIPKIIKILKKLAKIDPIESFFYAEYRSWTAKLLLNNLTILKEVYIDDGTLTLDEYISFIKNDLPYKRKRLFNDFVLRIQGCKPAHFIKRHKNFEMFTIFDIKNSPLKISKNELLSLKKKHNVYKANAPIGFIGQGAVGSKNFKTCKKYIEEVKQYAANTQNNIIYFPHRSEIPEVTEAIKQIKNITYHKSYLPLELEVVDQNIKLSSIIGTFSTALYSFSILYPTMPIYNLIYTETKSQYLLFISELRYEFIRTSFLNKGILEKHIE